MAGRRFVPLALGAALTSAAGLAWVQVFTPAAILAWLVLAILLPTAMVALWSGISGGRLSLWVAVPVSAGVWFMVAGTTLLGPAELASAPTRVLAGLRYGWYELLLATPPVVPEPQLLVSVHALGWLSAYATAEVIARTRARLAALLPSFTVLAGALPFGADRRGFALSAPAFIVAALAFLLVRSPASTRGPAIGRRLLGGAPWIAGVTVAATLLGSPALLGPDRDPLDLRQYLEVAPRLHSAINPLDQVSAWLAAPDARLFTVAAAWPENWRIAVLDRFDGRTWITDNGFLPTHGRVPGVDDEGEPLHQTVVIHDLAGPWLPAAASPVEIAGVAVLADPETGMLLSRAPPQHGSRYEVVSRVRQYTVDDVRDAVPDLTNAVQVELPAGIPPGIRDAARAAVAAARSPFEQASALERYLRDLARNDPAAAPGHSYGHLAHFLLDSHRGTSEQFASAFAVMARSIGLPSRIAVGFRPGVAIAPGRWEVSGADALVWPEVRFAGLGWVPFSPTPDSSAAPGAPAEGQSAERRDTDRSREPPPAEPLSQSPSSTAGSRSFTLRPVLWPVAGLVGAAMLAYLGAVLLVPALRSRRRRRADPAARVCAAWCEVLAEVPAIGLTDIRALTTREIAEAIASRLGPVALAPVQALAQLADRAAFCATGIDDSAGDEAWAHHDRIRRLLRRSVNLPTRISNRLSPRVLRG